MKIIFHCGPHAVFKISDDKVTILLSRIFFVLMKQVIDQISSGKRSMLLFLITEKGPRAAKLSWRAALWPCLTYDHKMLSSFYNLRTKQLRYVQHMIDPRDFVSKAQNFVLFLTFLINTQIEWVKTF